MNIHTKSILQAGGSAALVGLSLALLASIPLQRAIGVVAGPDPIGLTLALLAATPPLNCLVVPLLGLLPLGAGLAYGYLVPRKDDVALGGALAGAGGGTLYGITAGLISLATHTGAAVALQDVEVVTALGNPSLVGVLLSLGIAIINGLIFGCIGGALWTTIRAPSRTILLLQRRPILMGIGSFALLIVCLLFACAANASYWSYTMRAQGVAPTSSVESIQAEVEALPAGNPAAGEQLFTNESGCAGCHSLGAQQHGPGPDLAGIGARAAVMKPGYSAEMYLYESIVNPDAYIVEGYRSGIMPHHYRQRLSTQEIADLLAFLTIQ